MNSVLSSGDDSYRPLFAPDKPQGQSGWGMIRTDTICMTSCYSFATVSTYAYCCCCCCYYCCCCCCYYSCSCSSSSSSSSCCCCCCCNNRCYVLLRSVCTTMHHYHMCSITPFTGFIISLSLPYSKSDSNPPLTFGLLQEVSLARSDSHIASIGSPRQKKDRGKGKEEFARSCCLLIVIKIESSNTTTHPLHPPHEHDADDEAGSDVNRGGVAPLQPEDVLFQSLCSSGTGIQSSKLRVGG